MRNSGYLREAKNLLLYLLLVFCLTSCVIHFVGQRTKVKGSSMEPSLSEGDNLIIEKLSGRFGELERFDVVVFPCRKEPDTYFIKRIIGLPGEAVFIDANGMIFIDGERLAESYGREVIKEPGLAAQTVHLRSDEYFVLGDNRNDSMDSRDETVGPVREEDIVGRACFRIYPLDKMGRVGAKAKETE